MQRFLLGIVEVSAKTATIDVCVNYQVRCKTKSLFDNLSTSLTGELYTSVLGQELRRAEHRTYQYTARFLHKAHVLWPGGLLSGQRFESLCVWTMDQHSFAEILLFTECWLVCRTDCMTSIKTAIGAVKNQPSHFFCHRSAKCNCCEKFSESCVCASRRLELSVSSGCRCLNSWDWGHFARNTWLNVDLFVILARFSLSLLEEWVRKRRGPSEVVSAQVRLTLDLCIDTFDNFVSCMSGKRLTVRMWSNVKWLLENCVGLFLMQSGGATVLWNWPRKSKNEIWLQCTIVVSVFVGETTAAKYHFATGVIEISQTWVSLLFCCKVMPCVCLKSHPVYGLGCCVNVKPKEFWWVVICCVQFWWNTAAIHNAPCNVDCSCNTWMCFQHLRTSRLVSSARYRSRLEIVPGEN